MASNQLTDFAKQAGRPAVLTTSNGAPVDDRTNTMTFGAKGPIALQDFTYMDEISHFDRERIPERVVHAKGAGAFGYFECTHDISKFCKADFVSQVGKRCPVAVRFSTVGGENGSADTVRDPRGFAIKHYTDEGIWDMVGNNTPVFFIRDPVLFPSFIHTQKRNPETHLKDADMFWDFISLRPETTHQVTVLMSDRGIPANYRQMNGYSSHTLKLVNKEGKPYWCKWHYKTDAGIQNLPQDVADKIAGTDPDFATRDLYNHIASGKTATWTVCVQIMEYEQAYTYKINPFDVTKVWPHSEFPLIPVGKLVLDRNPENYFSQVEQLAFAPSHMVPGIEPSPDKMLQGRLYSYPDTHRHRLGANYNQLPVNRPRNPTNNYQRDAPAQLEAQRGPNYFPNSFSGPIDNKKYRQHSLNISADVDRHESAGQDDFSQAGDLYRKVMTPEERTRLVENIAGHMAGAQDFLQKRAIANFKRADQEYGTRIEQLVAKHNANKGADSVRTMASGKPQVMPRL
eukprot:GFYU01005858.1.p2 GENE.GFYU01005858.1~~GFYU01005858.1.p2  ORF type:complete len:513 (-),score=183.87 GFYU01005858.1:130-1668(-)